jgi:hypothetical protein
MKLRWIRSIATMVVAGVFLGCGGWFGGIGKDVAPKVISGAVKGLADPDTQRQFVAAIDEGRVTQFSAKLTAGLVDGLLDTLEDPVRRQRLEVIVSGLVAKASTSVVDTMLSRLLDQRVQSRLRFALNTGLAEMIGVAYDTVGARVGNSEERGKVFGIAVHDLAKQATLGFQEALDDTSRDRDSGKMPEGQGALVIAADIASTTGDRILWTLGLGLAALGLGLCLTLVWAVRKNRLRRAELAQRDDAIQLLTEAIQSTATMPGADALHTVLDTAMRNRAGAELIRKRFALDPPP